MNTDIDDLVRDAVRRQEELAPDPDRIRAALPAHAARRARRHRTMALAAATVAVAAIAVTVPAVVLRDAAGPATPPATNTTGTTDATGATAPSPAPGMATAPLRYRPTWLPDGMAERFREAPVSDRANPKLTTTQLWKSTPIEDGPVQSAHIGLYSWRSDANATTHEPPVAIGEGGQPVGVAGHEADVNGRPAHVDDSTVTWQVDDHTKLMLVSPGMNLPEADLLRIARSVRPDTTRLTAPLRADRLPAGLAPESVAVAGNSPRDWRATLIAEGKGTQSYVAVSAGIPGTPDNSGAAGETLTVGGRTAHLAQVDMEDPARPTYRATWELTVELGEGLVLTVRAGTKEPTGASTLTREDVIAVAEHVVLDPNPDLGWLGR